MVLADLTGECDPRTAELIQGIENNNRVEFGDEQDATELSGEDIPLPPLYEYFIHRAEEIYKSLF